MPKPKSHSHARPSKKALVNVAGQVATIAGGRDAGLVHNWVMDNVHEAWRGPKFAVSKPRSVLHKAYKAARALNEAFGSLNKRDRKRVNRIVAYDVRLFQEPRLRDRTGAFQIEIDELSHTVFLLDHLFSRAAGKASPPMAGMAKLQSGKGRKSRTVNNPAFHDLVWGLLTATAEAGGTLTIDKNRNFHPNGGTLVEALTILCPHLPAGLIPNDLRRNLSTLQRIKALHSKAGELYGRTN